jgi:hypothetical protein
MRDLSPDHHPAARIESDEGRSTTTVTDKVSVEVSDQTRSDSTIPADVLSDCP